MAKLDLSRRDLAALALGALVPGIPSRASAGIYTALADDCHLDQFADHTWGVQRVSTYSIKKGAGSVLPRHRFEVRSGDSWRNEARRNRAELCCKDRVAFGRRVWFSYAFKVHSGTATEWNVLGQFHNSPDPGEAGVSPPFSIELRPDETLRFIRRYDASAITTSSKVTTVTMRERPLERGVWHRVVGAIVFDPNGAGSVDIWYDGDRIVSQTGVPIGDNDETGPYFKFGIYRGEQPDTLVVEYANMELGYSSLLSRVTSPLLI